MNVKSFQTVQYNNGATAIFEGIVWGRCGLTNGSTGFA